MIMILTTNMGELSIGAASVVYSHAVAETQSLRLSYSATTNGKLAENASAYKHNNDMEMNEVGKGEGDVPDILPR